MDDSVIVKFDWDCNLNVLSTNSMTKIVDGIDLLLHKLLIYYYMLYTLLLLQIDRNNWIRTVAFK